MPSAPAIATSPAGGKWPRRRRLLRRAGFRATYEQGMRRASRHFTIFGRLRPGAGGTVFGITASRKVGNAVVRNRLRRRTRALLRRMAAPEGGFAIVINPRPAAATAAFAALADELEQEVRRLCARLASAPPEGGAGPEGAKPEGAK